jgi:ankyrin repeat protein
MDRPGIAGHNHALVRACLANGQPEAAEYLVSRGAPLDVAGAAGIGRLDVLERFFDDDKHASANVTKAEMKEALALAASYGRIGAVEFLLHHGIDVDAELRGHGDGHTALHVAAFHGHADVVNRLLERGANVDRVDKTWGTPPLLWALTGWTRKRPTDAGRYYDVVLRLVAAGASVKPDLLELENVRADPEMRAALTARIPPR